MKKIIYLIFILSLVGFQKKIKNKAIKQEHIISKKDSLEIQNLVRNVYKWKEKHKQLRTCFNIGLLDEKGNQYIGIDWKEYNKIANLLKKSTYFSSEFIKSYENTLKYIDSNIKKNTYQSPWYFGELPPFGTDANEWCHCQDYPSENYWENLEIRHIKIKNNIASLVWNFDKNDNGKGYPLKVIKQNNKWIIHSKTLSFFEKHKKCN